MKQVKWLFIMQYDFLIGFSIVAELLEEKGKSTVITLREEMLRNVKFTDVAAVAGAMSFDIIVLEMNPVTVNRNLREVNNMIQHLQQHGRYVVLLTTYASATSANEQILPLQFDMEKMLALESKFLNE